MAEQKIQTHGIISPEGQFLIVRNQNFDQEDERLYNRSRHWKTFPKSELHEIATELGIPQPEETPKANIATAIETHLRQTGKLFW